MSDETTEESTTRMMEDALNQGQLEEDSDGGPTPSDEETSESTAGGHTPDSGPTETEESTEAEAQETQDEDETEGNIEEQEEERLEEDEVDVTDQDQDSESGDEEEEEEEEDEWFYEGEHSRYKTEEELLDGVDKKDDIINRQRSEMESLRQDLEEARSVVQRQREALPQDQQKEMAIRQYMKEELGEEADDLLGMSEEDLSQQPEKKEKLISARAKAETKYEQKLEEAEKRQEEQIKQRRERLETAREFVSDWVSPDKFEAHSSEDRIRLSEYFQESLDDRDYNRAELGVLLAADYGRDVAESYLEGVRQDFLGDRQKAVEETVEESDPDPKPQPQPSSEDSNTINDSSEEEENESFESESPLDTLQAGLANT